MAALWPLARQTLRQANRIRVCFCEALSALAFAVCDALPLPSSRQFGINSHLYDGQTGDVLAAAITTFDKQTGMIWDVRYPQTDSNGDHFTGSKPLASWDETVSYINSKLGD